MLPVPAVPCLQQLLGWSHSLWSHAGTKVSCLSYQYRLAACSKALETDSSPLAVIDIRPGSVGEHQLTVMTDRELTVMTDRELCLVTQSKSNTRSIRWCWLPESKVSADLLSQYLGARYSPGPDQTPECEMVTAVSYTHLRAHETPEHIVCRLLLEKKKIRLYDTNY
eukprot:TRINITY_DN30116_c0_g1_i1.p1 TRINITY_DN30116_c0_g1~~TRINITY_DN30116_c0_g1_i1.p1  ORF type:complete len:167 (+),score=23.79 TRINITY_DN30116_c0_g1_i1:279-779(+)